MAGVARRAVTGFTLMAMTVAGIAVHAQSVPDDDSTLPAGTAGLDIPKDVMLFGKNDPHLRMATAVVNGSIITGTDVDQRLALVILANGGKVPDEERDRLRLQVLRNIIDETLQVQEAAANDIKIAPEEIDQSYDRVATNFKSNPKDFDTYLRSHGSSANSMKRQIEGELAWQRLLRRKVQPYVNVSQEEVKGLIDRMKEAKGSEEFRISEIYLSATPETMQQVGDNATKILDQIKQGGSFQAYARQYSEASTAAVGGDLGWVRPAQLPDELARPVQQMQPGQIAGPIQLSGGFSIIYLNDKRKVLAADPRDATLSLKQIGINFKPGTTPAQAKAVADQLGAATKALHGCGTVNALAQKMGADVVENDGVKIRDLPPQLQQIMLNLQVGEATPPFGAIADGVRVLVVCGP